MEAPVDHLREVQRRKPDEGGGHGPGAAFYLALGLDSARAARAPVVGYHSVYSGVKFWSDFYRSNDGHNKLVSAQTGYPLAAIVIFEVEQLLQMMVRKTYTRFVQIFAG